MPLCYYFICCLSEVGSGATEAPPANTLTMMASDVAARGMLEVMPGVVVALVVRKSKEIPI